MKAFAALSDLILKPSEYRIVSETTLCQVGWSVSYKRQTGRQTGRQAGRQTGRQAGRRYVLRFQRRTDRELRLGGCLSGWVAGWLYVFNLPGSGRVGR
jgi:hypothetical protein